MMINRVQVPRSEKSVIRPKFDDCEMCFPWTGQSFSPAKICWFRGRPRLPIIFLKRKDFVLGWVGFAGFVLKKNIGAQKPNWNCVHIKRKRWFSDWCPRPCVSLQFPFVPDSSNFDYHLQCHMRLCTSSTRFYFLVRVQCLEHTMKAFIILFYYGSGSRKKNSFYDSLLSGYGYNGKRAKSGDANNRFGHDLGLFIESIRCSESIRVCDIPHQYHTKHWKSIIC